MGSELGYFSASVLRNNTYTNRLIDNIMHDPSRPVVYSVREQWDAAKNMTLIQSIIQIFVKVLHHIKALFSSEYRANFKEATSRVEDAIYQQSDVIEVMRTDILNRERAEKLAERKQKLEQKSAKAAKETKKNEEVEKGNPVEKVQDKTKKEAREEAARKAVAAQQQIVQALEFHRQQEALRVVQAYKEAVNARARKLENSAQPSVSSGNSATVAVKNGDGKGVAANGDDSAAGTPTVAVKSGDGKGVAANGDDSAAGNPTVAVKSDGGEDDDDAASKEGRAGSVGGESPTASVAGKGALTRVASLTAVPQENHQEEFLSAIEEKMGGSFKEVWMSFLGESDVITNFNCDKQGRFTVTLDKPFMKVVKTDDPEAVGGHVVLMFGATTDGKVKQVTGRFAKEKVTAKMRQDAQGKLSGTDHETEMKSMVFEHGFKTHLCRKVAFTNTHFVANQDKIGYVDDDRVCFWGSWKKMSGDIRVRTVKDVQKDWGEGVVVSSHERGLKDAVRGGLKVGVAVAS